MTFAARRRTVLAWAALVAISLQALWPLIAHARPRSVTLVPVCTIAGETHYMEIETGGGDSTRAEHCKACPVGAAALASNGFHPGFSSPPSTSACAPRLSHDEKRLVSIGRPRAPPSLLFVEAISDNQEKTNEEGAVLRPRA